MIIHSNFFHQYTDTYELTSCDKVEQVVIKLAKVVSGVFASLSFFFETSDLVRASQSLSESINEKKGSGIVFRELFTNLLSVISKICSVAASFFWAISDIASGTERLRSFVFSLQNYKIVPALFLSGNFLDFSAKLSKLISSYLLEKNGVKFFSSELVVEQSAGVLKSINNMALAVVFIVFPSVKLLPILAVSLLAYEISLILDRIIVSRKECKHVH
jgi:hypothetical protein